jgi:ketol-acid reductoisomerase
MLYDSDADLSIIQGRNVAVLGYGSQGHAHSLSLRRLGRRRPGRAPREQQEPGEGEAQGLRVVPPAQAVEESDVIMVLVPDHVQRHLYADSVAPNIAEGDALFFGHGFNIRFGYIKPPAGVDVCMVAPKGPGHLVRREFVDGRGVPVLVAVEENPTGKAWPLALSYAKAIGGLRAGGIRRPSPRRPRPTCSASRRALRRHVAPGADGFEVLTEAGYQPEVAYFECLHELKLIVDLMYEGGIAKQRWSVSDTASTATTSPARGSSTRGQADDARGPRRHQGRLVRRPLHRRPGRRRAGVQAPARRGEQHPIEATGPRAAPADGVGQGRRLRLRRGHRRPLTPSSW